MNKVELDDLPDINFNDRSNMGILYVLKACLIIKGYENPIKNDVARVVKDPKKFIETLRKCSIEFIQDSLLERLTTLKDTKYFKPESL